MTYDDFLKGKIVTAPVSGFHVEREQLNPALKPHQKDAVQWALAGGRRALFESFGLGKTAQELEFCNQVIRHEGGKALIVLPLGVRQEFSRDAANLLHIAPPEYVRTMAEAENSNAEILMTNYERVRDGDIDPKRFTVTCLDEASVLRSYGSKTFQSFMQLFRGVKYKLVATATPSPNKYKELIHTSIPFSNHYEYTPSYNDFGHNEDTKRFFAQMDYLTPELLRILRPGRVAAIHVKDRVLFGNTTGYGMPSMEPFHAMCIDHYMKHGFIYFGMITVVTDVVRENNQTYRLGWTEQCKDGTKMGVGCPEYILLFRKLPTDTSKAYADVRVEKSKEEYSLAQWQIDAHAYWRSSGNRLLIPEELARMKMSERQRRYHDFSKANIYDYHDHVELAVEMEKLDAISKEFMTIPVASTDPDVWDDISRMKTLNTTQSRRRQTLHVCPLQLDIVERIINRYSNVGDLVLDPFGGLGTVALTAMKMGRKGYSIELNPDYFHDAVGYLKSEDEKEEQVTLFDLMAQEGIL